MCISYHILKQRVWTYLTKDLFVYTCASASGLPMHWLLVLAASAGAVGGAGCWVCWCCLHVRDFLKEHKWEGREADAVHVKTHNLKSFA